MKETAITVTMTRRFNTTAEIVFDAFLDPKIMKKWFLTTEPTNKTVKNEPYVGGTWETVDHRDGTDYWAIGTYVEIDRPNRLMLTLQMPQLNESTDTITVELKALEQGCEMTFTQNIPVAHEAGWTSQDIEKAANEAKNGSERVWDILLGRLKEIVEG
jgi:uncharacterized protein YndB with AHSA1/START domain